MAYSSSTADEAVLEDMEDLFVVSKACENAKGDGMTPCGPEELQQVLLSWYDGNRRLLPWRGDSESDWGKTVKDCLDLKPARSVSAYATWVSEVMLQQTRVETVISYFKKWMEKFPDVGSLANAFPEEVNAIWAGLGYYSRARNLHTAAKKVVDEFNGEIPGDVKRLKQLPGIGDYTAGAIASIAFGLRVPVVDGNVVRVFSRLCAVKAGAKDKRLIKGCWELGKIVVPKERPGDFNQALMELGATVCMPKKPACQRCPVKDFCKAFNESKSSVEQYPIPTKRKELPVEKFAVAIFEQNEPEKRFLFAQRPKRGLLANQWEFLLARMSNKESHCLESRRAAIKEFLDSKQVKFPCEKCEDAGKRHDCGDFVHTFTHLRHHLHVERISVPKCEDCEAEIAAKMESWAWLTHEEMEQKGLTKITSKCLSSTKKTNKKKRQQKNELQKEEDQAKLTAFGVKKSKRS